MTYPNRQHNGFTLIELMIVIVVTAILIGIVLPNSSASLYEQLRSASQILQYDIAYARSLATSNASTYRIAFDTTNNKYTLTHVGTNPNLNVLPDSAFLNEDEPDDQHTTNLHELLGLTNVKLLGIVETDGIKQIRSLEYLEFGPLGETTTRGNTEIWLQSGPEDDQRYISVTVNPVTGLTTIGPFTAKRPSLSFY